jgi:hypothetical protein
MWRKLKDSFERGIEQIKWFSSLLSERLKVEYSVMRLLYQSGQMEKKKEELMKTIGQRVLELKGYPDRYIMGDKVISEALSELEKIDKEIEETKKKASEISAL